MKQVVRFLFALLLFLPVAGAVSIVLYKQLGLIQDLSKNQLYFVFGAGACLIIYRLYRPLYPYIVGHELTHALCTWLCGGRVKSFRASLKGGEVVTTKSNFFISLAPYFFPIYTILLAGAFFGASFFFDLSIYIPWFIFLVAFSWAFHVLSTIYFIKMRQPDILKTGVLFSLSLVYIVNVAILAVILSLLFKEVTFGNFLESSHHKTMGIYSSILGWRDG